MPLGVEPSQMDFYPRPPRGGRRQTAGLLDRGFLFLSTPSARRATWMTTACRRTALFLSTPSARRATRLSAPGGRFDFISIHALREEGDVRDGTVPAGRCHFYPRPPRGGRLFGKGGGGESDLFLSTPSARRATRVVQPLMPVLQISIHALREEGDWLPTLWMLRYCRFLSTPSARRATQHPTDLKRGDPIFLSTPSARRATPAATTASPTPRFLSTPSARRATCDTLSRDAFARLFLSTPSARRATRRATSAGQPSAYFYPRPPRGGRLDPADRRRHHRRISIHALREEGDR